MLLGLGCLWFFCLFLTQDPADVDPILATFEFSRWGAWQQQYLDTDKWLWRLSYNDNALRKLPIKVMAVSSYISVNLSSKKHVFYACRPYSDLFRWLICDWIVAFTDSNSPRPLTTFDSSPLTKFSYTVNCLFSIGKSQHAKRLSEKKIMLGYGYVSERGYLTWNQLITKSRVEEQVLLKNRHI